MPGWPPEGSEDRGRLDALYWGDEDWNAELYGGEPGDFGVLLFSDRLARPLASFSPPHDFTPVVFARQWACLRSVLGDSRAERRRTFAAVPAEELTPIMRACHVPLCWTQPDRAKWDG